MSNVLFLVHRIPFPPDKGDKIRSYHLLKHLARKHKVYLGAFVDDEEDNNYEPDLESLCEELFLRPIGGWRSRIGSALSLIRGRSLSVGYYRCPDMRAWVSGILEQHSIDVVVAFSSTMAQYFPSLSDSRPVLIADFVDVDSDKWRQYSGERSGPVSWMYRYEAHALRKWELEVLKNCDVVSVVSAAESKIVPVTPNSRARVEVVANGVDFAYFDPTQEFSDPYGGNNQVVVFTGAMDYYANEDAVCWFAEEIWPGICSARPGVEFFIVGSNPTRAVQALARIAGVSVTGRVPDVRPFVRHASVVVAPLKLARGVQNKVLEALALNRPVVATPQALQGLSGDLPDLVTEAVTVSDFRQSVSNQLDAEDDTTVTSGQQYIRAQYDWNRNLGLLESFFPSS